METIKRHRISDEIERINKLLSSPSPLYVLNGCKTLARSPDLARYASLGTLRSLRKAARFALGESVQNFQGTSTNKSRAEEKEQGLEEIIGFYSIESLSLALRDKERRKDCLKLEIPDQLHDMLSSPLERCWLAAATGLGLLAFAEPNMAARIGRVTALRSLYAIAVTPIYSTSYAEKESLDKDSSRLSDERLQVQRRVEMEKRSKQWAKAALVDGREGQRIFQTWFYPLNVWECVTSEGRGVDPLLSLLKCAMYSAEMNENDRFRKLRVEIAPFLRFLDAGVSDIDRRLLSPLPARRGDIEGQTSNKSLQKTAKHESSAKEQGTPGTAAGYTASSESISTITSDCLANVYTIVTTQDHWERLSCAVDTVLLYRKEAILYLEMKAAIKRKKERERERHRREKKLERNYDEIDDDSSDDDFEVDMADNVSEEFIRREEVKMAEHSVSFLSENKQVLPDHDYQIAVLFGLRALLCMTRSPEKRHTITAVKALAIPEALPIVPKIGGISVLIDLLNSKTIEYIGCSAFALSFLLEHESSRMAFIKERGISVALSALSWVLQWRREKEKNEDSAHGTKALNGADEKDSGSAPSFAGPTLAAQLGFGVEGGAPITESTVTNGALTEMLIIETITTSFLSPQCIKQFIREDGFRLLISLLPASLTINFQGGKTRKKREKREAPPGATQAQSDDLSHHLLLLSSFATDVDQEEEREHDGSLTPSNRTQFERAGQRQIFDVNALPKNKPFTVRVLKLFWKGCAEDAFLQRLSTFASAPLFRTMLFYFPSLSVGSSGAKISPMNSNKRDLCSEYVLASTQQAEMVKDASRKGRIAGMVAVIESRDEE